jgi:biopolymer transport protein ExbD
MQAFKVEMMKSSTGGEDDTDFSVLTLSERNSIVQSDGTLVLTAPRRGSALRNLFRKRQKTKVILLGDSRVPFMALYQVRSDYCVY